MDLKDRGTVTAQYSIYGGGGTAKEFPKNLLDQGHEDWNKWLDDSSTSSWVKVSIDSPINVRGFGFMSANDAPERDPETV